ncbi:LURP1-like domain-containing protein [Cynara cardunculus var. scolymus]|uniref:LURP1-like domain-containing protein n=1 Tax=Cynara cardunculus var. scolymus TaxID=59895 RepID=A0A124SI22_CYNCS|nr:LURP1-like domain-containing protein [Cynara cardunculus var. scolymus]
MMVVVDAQYVKPYAVDLVVQRKSAANSNDRFTVVDVHGNMMFKIKDIRFSIHGRHILFDATDKPVLTFRKKLRSIHGRWQAFKGENTGHKDLLFSVKKSMAAKHETELDVFLVENKEETTCDCKVKGDWETKSCTIYAHDGCTSLAEVHDKQNIKGTFGITVYPEVDYAFIVALAAILTEIKSNDDGGKKKKKKKKKMSKKNSEKKNSDSSDDDKKVENKDDEKEEEDTNEEEKEPQLEQERDHDEGQEDDDYDDDDDFDEDDSYEEEPKYDIYNDGDDNDYESETSSSDEDESPEEKTEK